MIGELTMRWEVPVGVEAEIAQLRRGDLNALSALLARYQNRLYRYLLRIVRDPATAEDLFQQTWLRVAEKIRSFDPKRNFEAWFFALARNLAIDHLRRVRPESLDEPAGGEDSAAASTLLRSADPPVIETLVTAERVAHLADAMTNLPVVYREVLTLRFEEEMKLEEIAEVMGSPLSTVKTRLRRGLENLRQNMVARHPERDWR
jgi:RNA polymerase sigma-70 factor, ECF subfamily